MRTYWSIGKQWLLRFGIFLWILVMLAGVAGLIGLGALDVYNHTAEEVREYAMETITQHKTYRIMDQWQYYSEYGWDLFDMSPDFRGTNNYRFQILDADGDILYSTLEDTARYEYRYTADVYENEWHWYPYYGDETLSDPYVCTIAGYYVREKGVLDVYSITELLLQIGYPIRYFLPLILLLGVVLLFVMLYRLSVHTGHRQYTEDVVLSVFDRIPYDLYMPALVLLGVLCAALILPLEDLVRMNMTYLAFWAFFGMVMALDFLVLALYVSTVARCKGKTLLRNTLIFRCLKLIWAFLKLLWRGIRIPFVKAGRAIAAIPLIWQAAVFAPILLVLYGLFSSCIWENFGIFCLWILATLILYLVILYAAYSFRILLQSGKALAEGNLRYKTDTRNLLLAFREHGENLNRIGEGMEIALTEKIRSERFKTELITNVSHDIKTPLTSIINYTDLLTKEPLEGKAREYTEVLTRQSSRLKKLIEDLIEASKASTGNIAVSLERLDVCQIVCQSLGEYAERLEAHSLRIVQTVPAEPIYAMVDGRQLWRVLDNLYSNVCKYALEGTRVYVVVTADATEVTVSIKNISRDVLVTDADELTERFVQGDSSRSSEGSGLGLNIAKSLTELQNGRLSIHCDGDLFRCDISFPVVP